MKKSKILIQGLGLTALPIFLTGCGDQVTVYPNEVGYEINAHGVQANEFSPGTHRLDMCGTNACPALLREQHSKSAHEVTIERVFLPESKVDLEKVTMAVQFRIKDDPKARLQVAQEVASHPANDTHERGSNRERIITSDDVWNVYLQRVVPAIVIDALKNYTIDQTLSEVNAIGHNIRAQVNESIKDLPVEVTELSFNNGIGVVPEEVITALRKLYAVEAEKERQIRSLEAGVEIEKKRQTYQTLRVTNDKVNAAAANIPYDVYVKLKIAERFSDAAEETASAAVTAAQNHVPFGVMSLPGSTDLATHP